MEALFGGGAAYIPETNTCIAFVPDTADGHSNANQQLPVELQDKEKYEYVVKE